MSLLYSARFSGSNLLTITNYTGNAAAFSVSAWVWPHVLQTSGNIMVNFQSTGAKGWSAATDNTTANKLRMYLSPNTVQQTGTAPITGWTHVIFAWDGTTENIYLNGNTTPDKTTTTGCSYGSPPATNTIGDTFNGWIAGVGYWSKSLSTTEVTSLYNSGNGLAGADLSGTLLTSLGSYYDFINSGALGTDSSGNSHTYTNSGGVIQSIGPGFSASIGTLGKPIPPVLQAAWTTSILAAFNLGEGTGSTAADTSGNAHTGTLTGSCTWTSGTYGNQLSLADNSTTGSYMSFGSLTALASVTAFTFSALCQLDTYTDSPRAGGFRMLIGTTRAGAGYPQCTIFYHAADHTIRFNARYNDYADLIAPAPALNTWVLITGRIVSNVQSLWYDGVKVAEQAVGSFAFAGDSTPVGALGDQSALQTGNNWSGLISMGLMATRSYSDAEIIALAADPFVWDRQPFNSAALLPMM